MARAAGITMSQCRLLEENGRAHFMTRRFDRAGDDGDKIHMQTHCGINHMDFNRPGAYSYEQAFRAARMLELPHADGVELFRRAVFNILARNQDDHTKSMAFLMDRAGGWRLAPAYDVIYSINPQGLWTGRHQMSLVGKRDDFTADDLVAGGAAANLKPRQAKAILGEVGEAIRNWGSFSEETRVDRGTAARIGETHRVYLARSL